MKIVSFFEPLKAHLEGYLKDTHKPKLLQDHLEDLFLVTSLNFQPVQPLLDSLYSPKVYKPHRDPTTLLCSLLLMVHHQVSSITDWVELTRSDSLLALLAGFDPDQTPGVGTYYDFLHRLMDGPYEKPCPHTHKRSSLLKRSYQRSLDHEADKKQLTHDPNHPQSQALAQQLLQNPDQPRPNNFYKILEDLFIQLALIPSIEQGHLNPKNLTVSGDGSALSSRTSSHPRSLCSCRHKGIYRCSCPKAYTSSTARWCWDQSHRVFKFGDRFYHLITTQDSHDFPLLTHMPGGNESDHTLSLKTLDRLLKASDEHHLPLSIAHFAGDGHHDNYGLYGYLDAKLIIPVIPLNENSQHTLIQIEGLPLTDQGIPLCPQGAEMRHHRLNGQRHVYACPAKRMTHRNGQALYVFRPELCPINQDCKPQSPQGPWVSIPMETNPRYFPPIPRSTQRFKLLYNQRSATERSNQTKKNTYKVNKSSHSADYSLIRLVLADILIHAKIWYRKVKDQLKDPKQLLQSCLDKLPMLTPTGERSPGAVANEPTLSG